MPLPYYQNKIHIQNWREKNYDKMILINRKSSSKYYAWKRISTQFLNILIDI
jgi:hypothetical protein